MALNLANKIELTLCILKPHVIAAPHVKSEIHEKILKNGFYIIQSKTKNISITTATEFYKEHVGKFFFNRLLTFMCSGPCTFNVLAKVNAVDDWRSLLGPTKVYKSQFTHPESIRGMHGLTDTRNAGHGSDSSVSAVREIGVFFPDLDTVSWLSQWSDHVSRRHMHWDAETSTHKPSQS